MQHIKIIIILMIFWSFPKQSNAQNEDQQKVLFCYGDFYPEQIKDYTYVIVESLHFSKKDIAILKESNTYVFAYISMGEVNKNGILFPEIEPHVLDKNELWDSYILDIENEETNAALQKEFEYNLKEQDFDGMFLDNIDNYTIHGPTSHKKEMLLDFLKNIKDTYPNKKLMQNAGLLITEDTYPYIDFIGIESIATNYDFDKKEYKLRTKNEFHEKVNELQTITKKFDIPIILIEYAITKPLRQKVIKRVKSTGWPFFIGNIDLQNIPKKIE
ncbi:endo alpha-1,4 polygalactosaminidase [Mesonia sp. MT50]|uniref:Endo alpha-1,4 polygalactosaminidase n=1 Tax=Mesonia profundi TaxID=3070998 RepID=A0ABU1A454_9FLAO|nr:endo alpha-1,4 polygalactosaminidase [Mesonia profundi]MDQ7918415.1 endo alpha-1,4 polygalactosaminidase [Mesonia profundi]